MCSKRWSCWGLLVLLLLLLLLLVLLVLGVMLMLLVLLVLLVLLISSLFPFELGSSVPRHRIRSRTPATKASRSYRRVWIRALTLTCLKNR